MKISSTLHQTKLTKGAVRYDQPADDDQTVRNVYVRLDAIEGTPPASIVVTIEAA